MFHSVIAQEAIECNLSFSKFDYLIHEIKDTTEALIVLEDCGNCQEFKSVYRHQFASRLYFERGLIELAKTELIYAVEKGLFLDYSDSASFWELFREISASYGSEFAMKLVIVQEDKLASMSSENLEIRQKLLSIHNRDQGLRSKPKYNEASAYEFIYKLYGDREDDEAIHRKKIELAREFTIKDSLVLLEFVDISDSLGYVPNPNDLMFNDISTLMSHTSHMLFDGIDDLYYKSVIKGTISPRFYAWYKGYYEEYFGDGKTFSYYYTHGENMFADSTQEEIDTINSKRATIGLPFLPFNIFSEGGIR